ncbi:DUF3087 domain-containing protein [Paraglaciecola sp. 2405UD69-4]|uniref:DUF3087 domain-containing protein n=1 Tax=Paraglaciecola sp. 2405UD69-4 TaxID=3391836 RepID=UPI0039C996B0
MRLIQINKERYRKHLNLVIGGCAAGLILGSLAISQILIALFPDPSGSHFHWNLLGVVISSLSLAWVLNKYRNHSFMTEVVYIWELKKALNKINRKILKIKELAKQGNVNALLTLQYSYDGSRMLWELDDNTIVMEELNSAQKELNKLIQEYQVTLDVNNYTDDVLKTFNH